MWHDIWPDLPVADVPIGYVTNGVHPRTWISYDNLDLLDRYFGPRFHEEPGDFEIWSRIERISDEELWRTHERRREHLVAFIREHTRGQLERRGATTSQLSLADDLLSPYALTISFARRFATYKRGMLLFRDPDRLIRLLTNPNRAVQLVFAGKAHPHDGPGKELIRDITHFARRPEVRSRITFIEDYDMNIAKYLTSGSDIWLNTPRRPMEASGTSGMKAAMNGALNLSVLDGWWAEAYDPTVGWAIGNGEAYEDAELQDEIESKALYNLLEGEVVPAFYERGRDNLPRSWIAMMKASIERVGRRFSSHRMLAEYVDDYYKPASEYGAKLIENDFRGAREVAAYIARLRDDWEHVSVDSIWSGPAAKLVVGDTLTITAEVSLGSLAPDDVTVELYRGKITSSGVLEEVAGAKMAYQKRMDDGAAVFSADVTCERSGQRGYSVRVGPNHPLLSGFEIPRLIRWA